MGQSCTLNQCYLNGIQESDIQKLNGNVHQNNQINSSTQEEKGPQIEQREMGDEQNLYRFLGKRAEIIDKQNEQKQNEMTQVNSNSEQYNIYSSKQNQNKSNHGQACVLQNYDIEGTKNIGIAPKIIFDTNLDQNPQINIQPWLKKKLQEVGKYEPPEKFVDEQSEFVSNCQMLDKSIYEGFVKNGKRHGYGINLTQNEYFEGSFQDGVRRGWGRSLTQDTQKSGYWEIDKIQRTMEMHSKDIYYSGECLNSLPHGKGMIKRHNISIYYGDFVEGRMQGKGNFEDLIENIKYEGEFQQDYFHGFGTYEYSSGRKYVGQFKKSKFNGQGEMFWPNNSYYKGQFVNGLFEGQGYFCQQDQQSIYDGQWKSGKRNGKGKHICQGIEVIGFWQNDVLQEDN